MGLANDVRLRDVSVSDLAILYEHQREPEANQMAEFPRRDREAFMVHWGRILADENIIKKTIVYEQHIAGNIVCFDLEGQPGVGYWLGKQYWGRGIATRALSIFLDYVNARPLYAYVAQNNIASIRVLQKCGFHMQGEKAPDESNVIELIMRLDKDSPHAGT